MATLLRTCEPFDLRGLSSARRFEKEKRKPNPSRVLHQRRSQRSSFRAAMAAEGLKKGIAEFYNESSGLWESIWGEHMHHGFYDTTTPASFSDHRSAQIRMVDEALRFAGVPGTTRLHSLLRFYLFFF